MSGVERRRLNRGATYNRFCIFLSTWCASFLHTCRISVLEQGRLCAHAQTATMAKFTFTHRPRSLAGTVRPPPPVDASLSGAAEISSSGDVSRPDHPESSGAAAAPAVVAKVRSFVGSPEEVNTARVTWDLWNEDPSVKLGVMVAGNSGRPGGAIYDHWEPALWKRLRSVHPGHTTQEECLVASWLVAAVGAAPHQLPRGSAEQEQALMHMDNVFKSQLWGKWGMVIQDLDVWDARKKAVMGDEWKKKSEPSEWPEDLRKQWYFF